ncbi:YocN [Bacillus freudenreichii]|nr:YocN [Bacillus freudenreichii]
MFGPVVINLLVFKVNTMDRNASVNLAASARFDVFLANKQNYGLGEENGDFSIMNVPLNLVNDQDVNDTNAQKTSVI